MNVKKKNPAGKGSAKPVLMTRLVMKSWHPDGEMIVRVIYRIHQNPLDSA